MADLPGLSGLQLGQSCRHECQQSEPGCVVRFSGLGSKLIPGPGWEKRRNDVQPFDHECCPKFAMEVPRADYCCYDLCAPYSRQR